MTTPIFQAPLPPSSEQETSQQQQNQQVNKIPQEYPQSDAEKDKSESVQSTQSLTQKEQVLNRLNELKGNFIRYFLRALPFALRKDSPGESDCPRCPRYGSRRAVRCGCLGWQMRYRHLPFRLRRFRKDRDRAILPGQSAGSSHRTSG